MVHRYYYPQQFLEGHLLDRPGVLHLPEISGEAAAVETGEDCAVTAAAAAAAVAWIRTLDVWWAGKLQKKKKKGKEKKRRSGRGVGHHPAAPAGIPIACSRVVLK